MSHPTKYKLQTYRKRVKFSRCRRTHRAKSCRRIPGCKYAHGTIRRYCRKIHNSHIFTRNL